MKQFKVFIVVVVVFVLGFWSGQYYSSSYAESLCDVQAKVLFSPEDYPKKFLIDLIDHEQKSIFCALYIFTDFDVAKAMVRAKDRGIIIKIVIDSYCLNSRNNQVKFLRAHEIPVVIYEASKRYIMHNKFVLFEKNIQNKKIIWTGSFNLTYSANKNQENVIVLENDYIFGLYLQKFNKIFS